MHTSLAVYGASDCDCSNDVAFLEKYFPETFLENFQKFSEEREKYD